jgi:5-(carboxyamino)imidazole ribonucleotide mutase
MTQVGIFIGSISDKDTMLPCTEVLESLGISFEFTVSSAHRTPERTDALIEDLEQRGCRVFICAAGLAAHLAGHVASKTLKPVLGVPLDASSFGGMDAMLSTVQMPPGYPVGTLAVGKVGAKNAAWLAAQILALSDQEVSRKIAAARTEMQAAVEDAAKDLASSLSKG